MGVDAKRIWHPRGPNSSFQIRLSAGGINGTIPHEEKGTKPVNDDSGIFNCYKVRPDPTAPRPFLRFRMRREGIWLMDLGFLLIHTAET